MIRNFKKELYLSKKPSGIDVEYDDNGNPIMEYGNPIDFINHNGINYQPISAKSDMEMFGANSSSVHKALLMENHKAYDYFDEDSVGDLVYLNGASPYVKPSWDRGSYDHEPRNGFWANFEVNAVRTYNLTKHVYFVKHKTSGVQ